MGGKCQGGSIGYLLLLGQVRLFLGQIIRRWPHCCTFCEDLSCKDYLPGTATNVGRGLSQLTL